MASLTESLRLLSDPTRIRLLLLLSREELSVAELQEILGMGQSRISTHLARMKHAGLVQDRRAGKNIYYGLARNGASNPWANLEPVVRLASQEIPETGSDATALTLLLTKRKDLAREYFNRLAGKFSRNYCPGRTWRGLAHLLLEFLPPMVIADLGAGEGTLSQLLAKRAHKVIAVDNSEKMVEFGTALIREHGFTNLEYRLGDIESPPIEPKTVDLALFSQALHHATNPKRAVHAAYDILKEGGRIAILDLLAHNFEDAKELYADLWLGFSEVDLHQMLEKAGFKDIQVSVVARDEENPQFQTILALGTK
jgi:ubiquinone/menaquinone biosynthesis C-methylase UbiE/biotin operon repressor